MRKKISVIFGLILSAGLLAGCGSISKILPEEGTTEVQITQVDYEAGFQDDGTLADINPEDYVTLCDYSSISISSDKLQVKDEEVQTLINQMLEQYQTQEELEEDHEAQKGDTVNISYTGTIDGEEFPGGRDSNYNLKIGSNSFVEGFEKQLIGHKKGETVEVSVAFPESYPANTEIAGKEAVFTVTINYITNVATPELTDDFVKDHFSQDGVSSVKELKSKIRSEIREDHLTAAVWSYMRKHSDIKTIPEEYLDQFLNKEADGLANQAESQGYKVSDYLKALGYEDMDAYRESTKEQVTKTVEEYMIADLVAEKEGIVVTDSDVETFAKEDGSSDTVYVEQYGESYVKRAVLDALVMNQLKENVKEK